MDSKSTISSTSRRSLLSRSSQLTGGSESRSGSISKFSLNTLPEDTDTDKIGPLGLHTLFIPSGSTNADLIFVHGLGGGSRKTWTKSGDPSLYWPKEWLPDDSAFQDVGIHTFGYDSNWGKKGILGIQDFANALLNAMLDCPTMPRGSTASTVSLSALLLRWGFLHDDFQSFVAHIYDYFT